MFHSGRGETRLPAVVRSPRAWLAAMTAVGLTGGGLAISRATETHWHVATSLSRLGVDQGAAGTVTVTWPRGARVALGSLGRPFDRVSAVSSDRLLIL